MSDLAAQIAYAQKELLAIKSGFAGNPQRFRQAVVTTQTFTLNLPRPAIITVAFEYDDWPQLYDHVYDNTAGFDYGTGFFDRKEFYKWRSAYEIPGDNYTITCTLLSEKPPTLFTIEVEP